MPGSGLPTATTVLDSILFRDAFGTPQMRAVFSDFALIARYVEVEVALARAEARCGVIPANAGEEIAARSDVNALDFDLLRRETDVVGYPILPLVHQLVKQCGEAGRYVHWGATTQDIMDTALVLQMREGLRIIEDDIAALRGILAGRSSSTARAAALGLSKRKRRVELGRARLRPHPKCGARSKHQNSCAGQRL
jgi:3-carboxy-cis,cis-muconate cycloisomerase